MKNVLTCFLFCVLLALPLLAQTPSPSLTPSPTSTPTPKPIENDEDIVKISTTLIQVDVTVTDKDGKIVTGLKPEDFEIYENGKKQEVTNFSSVVNNARVSTAPTAVSSGKDKNAVPVPPVPVKSDQVRRTIVLMVDDLGLSFESMYYVRRSLKKFVDEQMQPDDLVAVIRTSGGVGALQQFTSDKRQLYATIESIKWNATGRSGISAFASIEPTPLEQAKASGATVSDEQLQKEREQIAGFNNFREDVFSVGTLGTINFVVNGMRELPGRKSIMLFSDGFSISPNTDDPDRGRRTADALKKLTELANRATVTIYTMDARGLQTLGLSAADNTSSLSSQQIQQKVSDRTAELLDKQDGLSYLAKETGGRAFFNNNDLNKSLDKALADQTGFYILGYQPEAETFDPQKQRFNKLEVKLKRKDLNVRYRSGFFGVVDKEIVPAKKTPAQQITTALTSPFFSNDIDLHLNTVFGNNLKLGSFLQSFLHIKVSDLKFTNEADGTHKASFDILAVSFGAGGVPVDQINKNYTVTIKDDSYKELLEKGFVYNFIFPVKKAGAYQMRVALRDSSSAKIGSAGQFVEVPDVKKDRVAVSGIVLENLTQQEWKAINDTAANPDAAANQDRNPSQDTSLRRFKQGTVLQYGLEIYNAKLDQSQKPSLQTQVRIFRDGKEIYNGKANPLNAQKQTDLKNIKFGGALSLGAGMEVGDYVMQIVVTDTLAKDKNKIATQWVQFEVIS